MTDTQLAAALRPYVAAHLREFRIVVRRYETFDCEAFLRSVGLARRPA